MLRRIRIALATVFFLGITLLFLDFTGTAYQWIGWMAKIQFLPAVLALNLLVVVALIVLTLIVGRIYCSVICPLGVLQDIVAWLGRRGKRKKNKYRYSAAKSWLRYVMLAVLVVAIVAGVGSVVALIAPYSTYGRIVQNLLQPLWEMVNNLLADYAERHESYAFWKTDVWMRSLPTFGLAALMLVVIAVLAWRYGRTWCNSICPVGTVLGFLARFSYLKPFIDQEKCNKCGLCERRCKAACIESKSHRIDYSRCVACMDCLGVCHRHAISYRHPVKAASSGTTSNQVIDKSRRTFLAAVGSLAATAVIEAQEKKVDGGLAVIEDKKIIARKTPIVPPGALGLRNMSRHCTGCQLCIAVCPNGVLRPSTSLDSLMQPRSSYERGYCRPECTKCSEVCPAGAIRKISAADKSAIQIGHAVWVKENCIPLRDNEECGNCARHCPVGAISMVNSDPADDTSKKVPVVDVEKCIGCGACENLCPARPFSAIYVEGHEVHKLV